MNIGDHLVSPRIGYTHHGIYVGNDKVIHYSGFSNGLSKGEISLTSVEEFAQGKDVITKKHLIRTYNGDESVDRAYSRLGEDWYNVLLNNCEHFVTWCIVGFHSSSQVNDLISGVVAVRSIIGSTAANGEAQRRATEAAISLVRSSSAKSMAGEALARTATSVALKSTVSSSAGAVAALTTSAGLTSGASTATALTAGLIAAPAMPVIATVAVAVGVGYGVKKLIDWIWD